MSPQPTTPRESGSKAGLHVDFTRVLMVRYPNYRYQPVFRRTDIIRRRVRKDGAEDEKVDAVAAALIHGKAGAELEKEIQEQELVDPNADISPENSAARSRRCGFTCCCTATIFPCCACGFEGITDTKTADVVATQACRPRGPSVHRRPGSAKIKCDPVCSATTC